MASTRKPPRGRPQDLPAVRERVNKRIRPASKLPKRFRALIYGKSGVGKTRLVSTMDKVLLIDVNEEGTDSVRNDFDPDVYRVYFWSQVNDVYWYLQDGDHPYDAVALDGLTGLQDLCMKYVLGDEASRDASRDPDMPSRAVWGKVGELMKTQIINFRNLPMHVIFTATERKRATGEETDEPIEVYTSPALSPAIAGAAERAVGMIGYMQKRNVVVNEKGGKKRRVTRTRLHVGSSETFATKDRYFIGAEYVDSPHLGNLVNEIYGGNSAESTSEAD